MITPRESAPDTMQLRDRTLAVLAGYMCFVLAVNLWRAASGTGSLTLLIAQVVVIAVALRCRGAVAVAWVVIGDWLPLIVLPLLYRELPWASFSRGRYFDPTIQGWDQAIFGTQPARTTGSMLPWRSLSEVLHLAYIFYYVIIYLPAFVMYRRGRGFHEMMLALTVTVAGSFLAFSVFPVEGPRFAWGAPPGIPDGPIRNLTLFILERGSARGTAFPSSHVAIALCQTLSCLLWRRRLGLGLALTTALLAFGAVYGGFHYGSDVLAGGVTGLVFWMIGRRLSAAGAAGSS